MWRKRKPNPAKSALDGMAGGLIASYVMNQLLAALAQLRSKREETQVA